MRRKSRNGERPAMAEMARYMVRYKPSQKKKGGNKTLPQRIYAMHAARRSAERFPLSLR
jgi:hypothetical protein